MGGVKKSPVAEKSRGHGTRSRRVVAEGVADGWRNVRHQRDEARVESLDRVWQRDDLDNKMAMCGDCGTEVERVRMHLSMRNARNGSTIRAKREIRTCSKLLPSIVILCGSAMAAEQM